ncbi:MAG: hypothetical protein JO093_06090 [Acidobacteria bacterium]|nr:hypothetical protein [Acidobacteriota bacterium]MBV9185169.1 hypothetical protein [Acidobacteriota bacterium]
MAEHFSFDAVENRSPVGALKLTGTGGCHSCFDLSGLGSLHSLLGIVKALHNLSS